MAVDVMPTDPTILCFGNLRYAEGFAQAQAFRVPDETTIRILSPVYFLYPRLVALRNRGWAELRVSQ